MGEHDYGFDAIPFAESVLRGQGPELLTIAERDAIEAYALGGFERINRALRGQLDMTPELEHRIDRIRTGLAKYPLPADVRVTRETDASIFGIVDEESARALIDDEFSDGGFLSTSGSHLPPHSIGTPNRCSSIWSYRRARLPCGSAIWPRYRRNARSC